MFSVSKTPDTHKLIIFIVSFVVFLDKAIILMIVFICSVGMSF